jgi:CDP-6-deoxy-D-xylo-4-hexulose-3-dehydrase
MRVRDEAIPFAKAVFGREEIDAVTQSLEQGWLGGGRLTDRFEKRFAGYIGMDYGCLVNSGSSANLLAVRGLNLKEGAKVLTCIAGFPSTLNPIWHSHLQAVGVDLDLDSLNIDLNLVEQAIEKENPEAIIFAHTLGNPVDMMRMLDLCNKKGIKIIEDNCDAIGSEFREQKTGSFGDFSTVSFYASHHMTLAGAGGMVMTNSKEDAMRLKSLKEWGKEQVMTGFEGDHGTEFDSSSNGVPYDHRYSYSEMGYNFKVPELMAAFGLEQMKRLESFHIKRRMNFTYLKQKLAHLGEYFHFVKAHPDSAPSWFNFPLTIKDGVNFTRQEIVEYLENYKIRTRLFFAGNILRHSGFANMGVIQVGDSKVADKVHKDSFLLGIHPSQTNEMFDYMVAAIEEFVKLPR